MKAIIGRKLGMTQLLGDDGVATPVTLIQAGPVTVTQLKTTETDGYEAIQVGYGQAKQRSKSVTGHTKNAKVLPEIIREFRSVDTDEEALKTGASFDVSVFEVGDKVKVSGVSKGKGFSGTIKRWNFSRGPRTHGSNSRRQPGSIGSMYPQRVFKGKKMAGQLGNSKVSVRNLTVALVDPENNVIAIKGAVPGPRKSVVTIQGASA